LIGIVAYLFSVRLLLRHFTHEDHSLRSLFSRGVLFLMTFQIWLLLSKAFETYSPIKEGYSHIPKEPWGTLSLIVPFAVAYGLFRAVAPKLTKKAQQVVDGQPTPKIGLSDSLKPIGC